MADSVSTPRINSQYLDAFTGKTVIIVGKVTQLRGESAIIDSEGAVTALLNRVRSLPPSLVCSGL
jgi:replication factor A3